MTTAMAVEKRVLGNTTEITRSAEASRGPNALSKLAESDSEHEIHVAPTRKAGGGLLLRLQPSSEEDSSASEGEKDADAAYERTRRRLLPSKVADSSSSEEEDGDNGEGAYERMKKRLMATTGPRVPEKQDSPKANHEACSAAIASSEDEDDAPVRANRVRRLQLRKEKSASASVPSSSPRSRRSSPGLFVSPNASPAAKKQSPNVGTAGNDSDDSSRPERNAEFTERLQRIRAERLAKQKQAQEKRKRAKSIRSDADEDSESKSDGEDGRRLTQQSKPTRKAGKKAMEAMVRDQQRIVRNMQLTHQAKTKKRYGTKDLLAKFGFNTGNEASETVGLPTPDTSSLPTSPDAEIYQTHDTPPTSPPSSEDAPQKDGRKNGMDTPAATAHNKQIDPALPAKLDKGKGRAPEFQHLPVNPLVQQSEAVIVQNARLESKKPRSTTMVELSDSDDDLEVVPKSRFPVFDKLPEKKSREAPSLLHLRHLANLTSPGKKGPKGRKSMNIMELQISLQQKARLQAQKERQDKIEELRKKGIHIETEEEREKRQVEIEDMVAQFEKARQEDLKLAKLEREEAKKNGETGDGVLSSDESEDDDYVASGEEEVVDDEDIDEDENADDDEVELSGSEDEEELNGEETADNSNALLDEMAEQDDEEDTEDDLEQEQLNGDEDMEEITHEAPLWKRTTNRSRNVVVDDEDEEEEKAEELKQSGSPTQPATQSDAMAAFGFGNAGPAFGLTQAFAGTMANLDSASQENAPLPYDTEQDSLDFLRSLPDTQPGGNFSQNAEFLVPNSQAAASQQEYSQAGEDAHISLGISQLIETSPAFPRTQLSEVPEPTQDAGFLLSRSPAGLMAPPSTVETVMLQVAESPVAARKGKLHRRHREAPAELSDVDDDDNASGSELELDVQPTKAKDAFSKMKKAAKTLQKIDNFNKKTSWAKDAVDEQAEESEDEYAGLGGASDDEDAEEADAELAAMIDHNEVKEDKAQIAAYYAEKDRKEHDKNVMQLHQDIISGALRKRAGGGDPFDLSDPEDEVDMRRKKKQREFQAQRKALMQQDERIGKMAKNQKQNAFFNSMMDTYDDDKYDFLNQEEAVAEETQSQSQVDENKDGDEEISIPDSQAADMTAVAPVNPLKRKAPDSQEKENRPPHLRRTAAPDALIRKPMTLADVQHSVSELLEDPRVMVPDSQYSSESEDEQTTSLSVTTSRKSSIVDRLTLSRTSTLSSTTTTDSANLAFHAPSAASVPGFRVPSLLRRATSNFSTSSERSNSGASTPVEGVRRGGTGKSNIHAQAREAERRAVLEKAEAKRKEAMRKKVGKARGTRSILRQLGGGFE